MSHFTRVATKINSLPSLYKALDALGLRYAASPGVEGVPLRGYLHEQVSARLAIDTGRYDIGVVMGQDGCYELCADWWGVETTTGRTEREIVDEISHAYSCARVAQACEEAGYAVGSWEVAEDGSAAVVAEVWS